MIVALKQFLKNLFFGSVAACYDLAGVALSLPKARGDGPILVTGAPGWGGGPFTFLKFLLEELSAKETVVCSFRHGEIGPELEEHCRSLGISLWPRPDRRRWADLFSFAGVVRKVRPRMVLINVGTFSQYFHLLPLRVPTLYYSHSIWHHSLPPQDAFFLKYFQQGRERHILTVSAAAKASLDDVYFQGTSSPVHWVHNGLADKGPLPEATAPPIGVLTLGSVAWYKNPELWRRVAIKVVGALPPGSVEFVWAGHGELLSGLAASNVDGIRFIGFDPEPDRLIQRASVYFQPSQFESFGLGVCEAMMRARAVVVSRVGALPELVQDGIEGFLVDLDQEELIVERLLCLVRDSELRLRMATAARARFESQFTADHWRVQFFRTLEDLFDHR